MAKKTVLFASIFIVIAVLFLISTLNPRNHSGKEESKISPADSPVAPRRGFFMWVLPTPGAGQSFEEAYTQASGCFEFSPVWGRPTPFYELAGDLSGWWGQTFLAKNIRGKGMFPLIHVSFMREGVKLATPPGMENATLLDRSWRSAYKTAVIEVVKASKPLYLSLGNEVNRWFEKYGVKEGDPNGFQHYVSLYEEVYDAVKALSPETKVFCVFAREMVSENREADLSVLSMFKADKIDLLVFTSYPYAVQGVNRPSDIPDDYYSKALGYLPVKLFGFSELGWSSLEAFGGEEAQAEFVTQASGRLTRDRGVNLHLFGWAWLHDLDESDSIGLIKSNRIEKLAYAEWKNLSESG